MAWPPHGPAHRHRPERILLTAISSPWSFKNRFEKKRLSVCPNTLQARKSHPARPPPAETPPPPPCCRQRGLYNLKKSHCAARKGLSRTSRRGSFQEESSKSAGTLQLPPRGHPGMKVGLSTALRPPECTRGHHGCGAWSRDPLQSSLVGTQDMVPPRAGDTVWSWGRSWMRWAEPAPGTSTNTVPVPCQDPIIPSPAASQEPGNHGTASGGSSRAAPPGQDGWVPTAPQEQPWQGA